MFKIALLGCENSHATAFAQLIADGKYPDISIEGAYSNEPEAMKKLNEKFGIKMLDSYDELVGKVDGIMITARHGDNHYKYAKPYLASGIPMFIDKPITCTEEDAVAFMRDAKKNGVRLCGGSVIPTYPGAISLREGIANGEFGEVMGGDIVCPIDIPSVYGGFLFYAQHLVQTMLAVFGYEPKEVMTDMRADRAACIVKYDTFDVTATFSKGYYYHVAVFGGKKLRAEDLEFTGDSFSAEMNDMHDLLAGKEMKVDFDTFIRPVFVMNAILRSAKSGKWEKIVPEKV